MGFVMRVRDVFELTGRTAFVGEITEGPRFIKACDCELVVNGVAQTKLRFDEDMLCPIPPGGRAWRAISTVGAVDVALIRASLGSCEIRAA